MQIISKTVTNSANSQIVNLQIILANFQITTLNLKRKSAVSILIGSVQIRQWARVPDSALPARTLAIVVQKPLPSQILGEGVC